MDRPRDRSLYGETRMKVIERPLTVCIHPRISTQQISPDELLVYLSTSMGAEKMDEEVEGVQRLFEGKYELTFRTEDAKDDFRRKNDPLVISDKHMLITAPRQREISIFQQFTPVFVTDYPMEEDNSYLFQKLGKYGECVNITDLKYKGSNVRNGTRMARFKELRLPVPTSMYCRNMRVRMRHDGQDRIPKCNICKEKGHWHGVCPMNKRPWPVEELPDPAEVPWTDPTPRPASPTLETRKESDIICYDDVMAEATAENFEHEWKIVMGKKTVKKRKNEEETKEGSVSVEEEGEQQERKKALIKKKRIRSPEIAKEKEREEEEMQEEQKTDEEEEATERRQKRKEKKKERRRKEKEEIDLQNTQRELFGVVSSDDSDQSDNENDIRPEGEHCKIGIGPDSDHTEKIAKSCILPEGDHQDSHIGMDTILERIEESDILPDNEEASERPENEKERYEDADEQPKELTQLTQEDLTDTFKAEELAHRRRAGNFSPPTEHGLFYQAMKDNDIFGTPIDITYTQQREMEDLESQGDITEAEQKKLELNQ